MRRPPIHAASIHIHSSATLSVIYLYLFIPQSTMKSKKKIVSTPSSTPVSSHNLVGSAQNKRSPPSSSDIRSTVLDPSGPDPTTTINLPSDVPSNTPTPVTTKALVDPTE